MTGIKVHGCITCGGSEDVYVTFSATIFIDEKCEMTWQCQACVRIFQNNNRIPGRLEEEDLMLYNPTLRAAYYEGRMKWTPDIPAGLVLRKGA